MAGASHRGFSYDGVPGCLTLDHHSRNYRYAVTHSAGGDELGARESQPTSLEHGEWSYQTSTMKTKRYEVWEKSTKHFTLESPAHKHWIIQSNGEAVWDTTAPPEIPATLPLGGVRRKPQFGDPVSIRLENVVSVRRLVRRFMFSGSLAPDNEEQLLEYAHRRTTTTASYNAKEQFPSVFNDLSKYLAPKTGPETARHHSLRRRRVPSAHDLLCSISDTLHKNIYVAHAEKDFIHMTRFGVRSVVLPEVFANKFDPDRLMSTYSNMLGYVAALCGIPESACEDYSLVCVAEGLLKCDVSKKEKSETIEKFVNVGIYMVEWASPRSCVQQSSGPTPEEEAVFAGAMPLFHDIPSRAHLPQTKLHPGCMVVVDLDEWNLRYRDHMYLSPVREKVAVPAHPSMATQQVIFDALGISNANTELDYRFICQ